MSWLEQVCLQSFLDHGHRVKLYTYDQVMDVPEGVEIADASVLLSGQEIIRHARTGSPAFHADLFRLKLMEHTNEVWVDTDAFCHRPLRVPKHGHLHGHIGPAGSMVNNGVLRLPKSSATLKAMLEFTSDPYPIPPWFSQAEQDKLAKRKADGDGVHVSNHPWGVWGPNALTYFLTATGEIEYAQPQAVLYPVPFEHKGLFFRPDRRDEVEALITDKTVSVHLWGRRFRSVAAKYGGVPDRASYVDDILRRHHIDPVKTAHKMKPSIFRKMDKDLDFSALGDEDLANLCLQRSSIVRDTALIKAWTSGDAAPLIDWARQNRAGILNHVIAEIASDVDLFVDQLKGRGVTLMADIGCGYGFADLLLYLQLDCDLLLIDIETSENRHFGFEDDGAGYASLAKAKAFLTANGVPPERITTINPVKQDLTKAGRPDAVISMISCGFHYHANSYDTFYRTQATQDAAIVLDIRKGSRGVKYLKSLGEIEILSEHKKHAKVLTVKSDV